MDEEKEKDIEMQLHEQFASNYDSGFSSTITLFCTMLAMLYGYGYMFLHVNQSFSVGLNKLYEGNDIYTLDALVLAAMVTTVTLFIMMYICVYQGISQRLEQFIIYAIRFKYYDGSPLDLKRRIYPSNYHPFKEDNKDLPVGLYGKFIYILGGLQIMVTGSMIIKVAFSLCMKEQAAEAHCTGFCEMMVYCAIFVFCLLKYIKGKQDFISKFEKRKAEYSEYNNQKK